jgi:hypothetical protein
MSLLNYFCEFVLENINYLEKYLIDIMDLSIFEDMLYISIFESHIDINPLKIYILENNYRDNFINFVSDSILCEIRYEYNESYDYYSQFNIELEDYLIQCLDELSMDNNMKNYVYEYFINNNLDTQMDINLDINNLSLS